MPEYQLKTPVAFIIFNRPDTSARVFKEIARARPPKLLIIGDGARKARPGEAEKVAAARELIRHVDWECTVETNFSDENMGCRKRVSSGLDWVFSQVEEAIILEDDCLPHPSFFRFCDELLQYYRTNDRIGAISGNNFQGDRIRNADSYYFSRYCHVWGWASWRSRWQDSYDVAMKTWPLVRAERWLSDLLGYKDEVQTWSGIFDEVFNDKIDTWDYQWLYANWISGRLSVLPNVNLVSNIGFGPDATHTTVEGDSANLPVARMSFPLRHPTAMICNAKFDRLWFKATLAPPLLARIQRKVRKWVNQYRRQGADKMS